MIHNAPAAARRLARIEQLAKWWRKKHARWWFLREVSRNAIQRPWPTLITPPDAVTSAMASISTNTTLTSIVAVALSALAITRTMAITREDAVGCIAGR